MPPNKPFSYQSQEEQVEEQDIEDVPRNILSLLGDPPEDFNHYFTMYQQQQEQQQNYNRKPAMITKGTSTKVMNSNTKKQQLQQQQHQPAQDTVEIPQYIKDMEERIYQRLTIHVDQKFQKWVDSYFPQQLQLMSDEQRREMEDQLDTMYQYIMENLLKELEQLNAHQNK
jgi:hypothetical protein